MRNIFVITSLLLVIPISNAQQYKIGKNINFIKSGVLLELEDTEKALLLTRVSNPAIAISTPYKGMIVFDSILNQLAFYNGTEWKYPVVHLPIDTSIYSINGTLTGDRQINMLNYALRFLGTNGNFIFNSSGLGKMGIATMLPKSALDIRGAMRADSLVLKQLPTNTLLRYTDTLLMINNTGIVQKTLINPAPDFDTVVNTAEELLAVLNNPRISSIFLNTGNYIFTSPINIPNRINRIVGNQKNGGVFFSFNYAGADASIYCITLNDTFIEFSNLKIIANIPNVTNSVTLIGQTGANTNWHNIKNIKVNLSQINLKTGVSLYVMKYLNYIDNCYVTNNPVNNVKTYSFDNCSRISYSTGVGYVSGAGFNNSTHLIYCTGEAIDNTNSNTTAGFNNCNHIFNCTGIVNGTNNATTNGFLNCSNIANSTAKGTGQNTTYGFLNCSWIVNSNTYITANNPYGFKNCSMLTSCNGNSNSNVTNSPAFGFDNCKMLSYCIADAQNPNGRGVGFNSSTTLLACTGKGIGNTSSLFPLPSASSNSGFGFYDSKGLHYCTSNGSTTGTGYYWCYFDFGIANVVSISDFGGWNR